MAGLPPVVFLIKEPPIETRAVGGGREATGPPTMSKFTGVNKVVLGY
jgi:hypothetical protein